MTITSGRGRQERLVRKWTTNGQRSSSAISGRQLISAANNVKARNATSLQRLYYISFYFLHCRFLLRAISLFRNIILHSNVMSSIMKFSSLPTPGTSNETVITRTTWVQFLTKLKYCHHDDRFSQELHRPEPLLHVSYCLLPRVLGLLY